MVTTVPGLLVLILLWEWTERLVANATGFSKTHETLLWSLPSPLHPGTLRHTPNKWQDLVRAQK